MTNALHVELSASNTLVLDVKRLPLGKKVAAPGGMTIWRVYVPSSLGGVLTIRHSRSMNVSIDRPIGEPLAFGAREATLVIPPNEFGDYFVCALGDDGEISAEFTQTFWSRKATDPSAEPLLPYNFYYWPARRDSLYASKAISVMKKYARATGKDPVAAAVFEHEAHQPEHASPSDGHCHNAAPASGLFEQPRAQVIRGQRFDEEEMELLAAEFYGNFGDEGAHPWTLRSSRLPKIGDVDALSYVKVGEEHTAANLLKGLKSRFSASIAAGHVRDAMAVGGGTEPGLKELLDRGFGQNGAAFFSALQDSMLRHGEPLLANMRSYHGSDGPDAVWNQMFFYCKATYAEIDGNNDKRDLQVIAELYSNIDQMPSRGLPAVVSNGTVVPKKSSEDSQLYTHVFRLIFDAGGRVSASDPRNEWRSIKNDKGEELYAPGELIGLAKPLTVPAASVVGFMQGNPVVGREFLDFVSIHARFR